MVLNAAYILVKFHLLNYFMEYILWRPCFVAYDGIQSIMYALDIQGGEDKANIALRFYEV